MFERLRPRTRLRILFLWALALSLSAFLAVSLRAGEDDEDEDLDIDEKPTAAAEKEKSPPQKPTAGKPGGNGQPVKSSAEGKPQARTSQNTSGDKSDEKTADAKSKLAKSTTGPAAEDKEEPAKENSKKEESKEPAGGTPDRKPEQNDDDTGLQAPPGFTVTRFADDSLAHDIFSMTLDSIGRVVVSGPGYVRILIDSDGDGKADRAIDYADGPKTGAQGLCFFGRDLLCTGDAGLIHFKDENGDDRADGPPELLVKIKTGGEHHAHAIRRGPDGWWYLMAGNYAEVTAGHAKEESSPIKIPHGGVILRIRPDASGAEIVADCFRNAYDFDFDAQGELFAYDSDGERDVSLPWYMPTRLFHVVPGGRHGWISESSKLPDYLLDSAPVVAATGRGSPAGMACYRHDQFPEKYQGGLFLLDWTFGRVLYVPLVRQGASYEAQQPQEFLSPRGEMGFAPTDIEVGTEGSLYICVGGRGTHGTVYRVQYTGDDAQAARHPLFTVAETDSAERKISACLSAPQPGSSWSRLRWASLAHKLGGPAFLSVVMDEQRSVAARVRAIEILTDLFGGLPGTAADILALVKSPEIRARAAWSLGIRPPHGATASVLVQYLSDADPLVRRRAIEAAARFRGNRQALVSALARCANDDDRNVRLATARLLPGLSAAEFKELADLARKVSWRAALTTTLGYIGRRPPESEQSFNAYGVDIGRRLLEGKHSAEMKLEAARLIELAVGDISSDEDTIPVFANYAAGEDLTAHDHELDALRIALAKVFPAGTRELDLELARVAAIVSPPNDELLTKVLSLITPESDPIDDIHYLIVAARLPCSVGPQEREKTAQAMLDLDAKMGRRNLRKDNNWNVRVGEMYAALVERDPALIERILEDEQFGRPGHVVLMKGMDTEQWRKASAAFLRAAKADPEYAWNIDVVNIIGYGRTAEGLALLRDQFEKFELRAMVLTVLAQQPAEIDRERFAAGLDSPFKDMPPVCVGALEKLPRAKNEIEIVGLVKLLGRLKNEKDDMLLRERVIKLLERNTGEKIAFVFGPAGFKPQSQAVDRWTEWATKHYPEEAARQLGAAAIDLGSLKERLAGIDWDKSDIERGKKLYTTRGCAQCHGSGSGLGPDLAGVANRFSRDDLFVAIALPNRDVSPRYQTVVVETKSGQVYTGMLVYESADVRVLRNGVNQTFRIDQKEIESERKLASSLMPEGLLRDLKDEELADLYAYLKSLSARTADAEKPGSDRQ